MDEFYHLLDALVNYVRFLLQFFLSAWFDLVADLPCGGPVGSSQGFSSHFGTTQTYGKYRVFLILVKLSSLIEKNCGDKFRVVVYKKKRFVTVVGLTREEQADCLLAATYVHDKNCDKKNKTWI
jgi:hypothetical protein